jgi:hypothetical protein
MEITKKNAYKLAKPSDKTSDKTNKRNKSSSYSYSDYEVTNITTKVNNKELYRVTNKKTRCVLYFIKNKHEYIYTDANVLIKIDGTTITDDITDDITKFLLTKPNLVQKNRKGILSINFQSCTKPLNLVAAKNSITKLNTILVDKCNDKLNLNLDYIYNMEGMITSFNKNPNILLLCLTNNVGCISSLVLEKKDTYMYISSMTHEKFEGKKYNKLLRAIIIIIAPLLNCTIIKSEAINPVSAWLLINYYNAVAVESEANKPFNIWFKDKAITMKAINDYAKQDKNYFEVELEIEINSKNIAKANDIFNTTITNDLLCE